MVTKPTQRIDKINLKNIGPIEKLTIPVPEQGGVVVLRGGQGAGKSTALRAVSKALGGSTRDLSPRDGTTKGEVWLGEVKLTVSRARQSVKGELQVDNLEGRFDISKLVDPQIQDPVAADAARIKALIALSGAKADPQDFYDVVGGKEAFGELGIDSETSDPIVLAGRVQRALHAKAKQLEKLASDRFAEAKAKQDSIADVDLKAESNADRLQREYDEARDLLRALEQQREQHAQQKEKVRGAEEQLAKLESADMPTVEVSKKRVEEKTATVAEHEKEVAELRQQLMLAEQELSDAKGEVDHAADILKMAERHEETVAGLRAVVDSAMVEPVDEPSITNATDGLANAREAVEIGIKIRQAKQALVDANEIKALAEEQTLKAESLRDKAREANEILSRLIPAGSLRIDEGRLVTTTDRSKSELYSELSDGERAALAIDIAVQNLTPEGMLIAQQWMWDGWTDNTRKGVHQKCLEHGEVLFTGEARDGELVSETYDPDKER